MRSLSSGDGCVWKDCSWLKSRCLGGSDVLWVWAGVRSPSVCLHPTVKAVELSGRNAQLELAWVLNLSES